MRGQKMARFGVYQTWCLNVADNFEGFPYKALGWKHFMPLNIWSCFRRPFFGFLPVFFVKSSPLQNMFELPFLDASSFQLEENSQLPSWSKSSCPQLGYVVNNHGYIVSPQFLGLFNSNGRFMAYGPWDDPPTVPPWVHGLANSVKSCHRAGDFQGHWTGGFGEKRSDGHWFSMAKVQFPKGYYVVIVLMSEIRRLHQLRLLVYLVFFTRFCTSEVDSRISSINSTAQL